MDVATIILGIALVNVAVFLVGCSIAIVRTRGERIAAGDPPKSDPVVVGGPTAEARLRHAGRRAH